MSIEITINLINGPGNVPPPTPPTAPTSPTSPTPPVPAVCGRVFVGVDGTLYVIDAVTGLIIDRIELTDGSNALNVTVNPFREQVYVSTGLDRLFIILDVRTLTIVANIALGYQVNEATYSPIDNLIYVNAGSGFIDILDGDTFEQVERITGLNTPARVVYDSRTNYVYSTNNLSNDVVVIEGTNEILRIVVGRRPNQIALNLVTGLIYVSVSGEGSIAVIDTTTNTVIENISVGATPYGIAVDTITNRVYVAVSGNNVNVYDGATNQLIDTLSAGGFTWGVALTPTLQRGFVTNRNSRTVSMIDLTTDEVLADIPVDGTPINITALEFIC
ncbi:YncE family protein [Geomicrobium sp. JSM 1781026]|uniref:YncE family protein n=1 Tax=Geomicrobium sp. JSM 1781026 TaxID=3344580 RepID=UPI0035BFE9D2